MSLRNQALHILSVALLLLGLAMVASQHGVGDFLADLKLQLDSEVAQLLEINTAYPLCTCKEGRTYPLHCDH